VRPALPAFANSGRFAPGGRLAVVKAMTTGGDTPL